MSMWLSKNSGKWLYFWPISVVQELGPSNKHSCQATKKQASEQQQVKQVKMNGVGAPSQSKRPPEKGSFPLDHYGECKPFMKDFLACMKEHRGSHIDCKHLSKSYLQCRMDKGLMQEEELDSLGFHEEGMKKVRNKTFEGRKEEEGFVAGLGIKTPRYKE